MSLDKLREKRDAARARYVDANEVFMAALQAEMGDGKPTAKAKRRGWPKGKKRGKKVAPKEAISFSAGLPAVPTKPAKATTSTKRGPKKGHPWAKAGKGASKAAEAKGDAAIDAALAGEAQPA
jgi:hypothetical protein